MKNFDQDAQQIRDQLQETLQGLIDEHDVDIEIITLKPGVFKIRFINEEDNSKVDYQLPMKLNQARKE